MTGLRTWPRAGAAAVIAAALTLAGCGGGVATPAPTALVTAGATPAATPPSDPPSVMPSPAGSPPPPAGTAYLAVPAAGILLPVPDGWELVDADALADPDELERIAAAYPGADRLLRSLERLGGRAEPVLLAADPGPASVAAPIATNLSVMVAQPSTSGILLDLVAGFIADGLREALGADADPVRTRVDLPAGEAVRLAYTLGGDEGVVAIAWVVGAPAGTLLVTAIGTADALDKLDPDALAAAIIVVDP